MFRSSCRLLTARRSAVQIADYYVDLLIDNVIQQGASRYTVAGLTENVANRTLMFLNGDIR